MTQRSGHGAKQPVIFSHERAAVLDDPERERWLPSAALVEILDAPQNSRVLDFGTGTGRYALAIARARPDLDVTAFDVQPEMLDNVRRRLETENAGNVHVAERADARAPYERILALNLLHEVGDDTLRGIAPLLAPGGTVLIVDWDASIDRPTGPPAEHTHTLEEARERLASAGFSHLERVCDARFPYHFILRARSGPTP
jgi:SAM-dependent methyltransferase